MFRLFSIIALVGASAFGAVAPKHIESMEYPQMARIAHLEGVVTADVEVDSAGHLRKVVTEGGHPVLAEAVKKSLLNWTFSEGEDGHIQISFEFQLRGEPRDHAITSWKFDLPDKVYVTSQPFACDHCPRKQH
jgi:hypothetical protein